MNKRTWWRAAAALVAGGASAGGWFGLAQAEPMLPPKVENTVWTRSAPPAPVVDTPSSVPMPVTPAAAAVPSTPVLPTPTAAPPLAKPATAVLPSPNTLVAPNFTAVPATTAAAPMGDNSATPATLPPINFSKPEIIVPRSPAPSKVAPPAQPVKSISPVQPVPAASPNFNLRPKVAGNNVKPEGNVALEPLIRLIPPDPKPESIKTPLVVSVSRPKPHDEPMPATEKFVYAIPRKVVRIVAAPKRIEKPAPIAPELPIVPMVPAIIAKAEPLAPELPIVPSIPLAPAAIEPREAIIPDAIPTITTPGDPMKIKQSTVATVIGGALALLSNSPAQAFPLPPKPLSPALTAPVLPDSPVAADAADIAALTKKLDDANKKLDDANREIKRLADLLEGMKDQPSKRGMIAEIKDLKDEVSSLKAQLKAMKDTSTSLKPVPNPIPNPLPAANDPTAGKGIVRIVNDYPVEIRLVVNNISHVVPANTKQDVLVPSGDFTYMLLNAASTNLAPIKSTIKEKEVVTLRIK